MKKMMYSIGLATTISMTMGLMMKLLHMRGGEQLLNYGFLAFALIFLPMVAIKKFQQKAYQRGYEKLKSLFGFLSAVGVGLAILFKITLNFEISEFLLITAVSIFSFGFLPLLFYGLYKESLKISEKV